MPQSNEVTKTPIRVKMDTRIATAVADEQWRQKRAGKALTPLEALQALRERGELKGEVPSAECSVPSDDSEDEAAERFDDFLTAVLRLKFGCGQFEHLPTAQKLDLYCGLSVSGVEVPSFADWLAVRYPAAE